MLPLLLLQLLRCSELGVVVRHNPSILGSRSRSFGVNGTMVIVASAAVEER